MDEVSAGGQSAANVGEGFAVVPHGPKGNTVYPKVQGIAQGVSVVRFVTASAVGAVARNDDHAPPAKAIREGRDHAKQPWMNEMGAPVAGLHPTTDPVAKGRTPDVEVGRGLGAVPKTNEGDHARAVRSAFAVGGDFVAEGEGREDVVGGVFGDAKPPTDRERKRWMQGVERCELPEGNLKDRSDATHRIPGTDDVHAVPRVDRSVRVGVRMDRRLGRGDGTEENDGKTYGKDRHPRRHERPVPPSDDGRQRPRGVALPIGPGVVATRPTMWKIAIMGTGMVGGALDRYFKTQNIEAALYDPPKGMDNRTVLGEADTIFVAVPTPYYLDREGFDDSFLKAAIEAIPVKGKTIVLKSTIIPGTTDRFQELYPQHRFLFNPEFLTETTADYDMCHPNRQVVGYTAQGRRDAEKVMGMLPRAPFEKIVPAKAAELVKYFGNAFYALKVTYANQMYDVCTRLGLDYDLVKDCAKAEPMVGPNHLEIFHKGYRGFGGKCLPKDTRSMIQLGNSLGVDLTVLKAAEAYNNSLVAEQGIDIKWEEGSPRKG